MQKLWNTKTFWGGIAAIVTGAGLIFTGDIPQGINAIVSGVLAIFVRDGILKTSAVPESESAESAASSTPSVAPFATSDPAAAPSKEQ